MLIMRMIISDNDDDDDDDDCVDIDDALYISSHVFNNPRRNITRFWSIYESFSKEDQALLLKFVTSCERPPR